MKKKKKAAKAAKASKSSTSLVERGYREVASIGGGINADWNVNMISEDSEVWQYAWALIARVRDLFRTNTLYTAYRDTLWANVFGSEGILLRMEVKETEDRIIHTPEEKFLEAYEERRNRVMDYMATKRGEEFKARSMLVVTGKNGSRSAKIKVGDPDVFANQLIERKWDEWQRREFCDIRGTRSYATMRQLRLISAVRDGDFFIRMVKSPQVNKFGFSTQLINGEWCDRFYNEMLPNGNEVRMGIEYEWKPWGLGKPVAYYFIKRQPNDWQFSIPGAFNFSSGALHDRVPADEIIHYARPTDADSTRPAPWVAATIPKARQLDQYELAEVIAARQQACKTGWLYSEVVPEGGMADIQGLNEASFTGAFNARGAVPSQPLGPGDIGGLPYGVKYQPNDPTHPNGNYKEFRQGIVQGQCSGMSGANYSTMANDYAAINFSAGRLQKLDKNEDFKLIQEFDIECAENPLFENWLYQGLMTGEIPLPFTRAKFDKFNQKSFAGRRWQGVDPVKDNQASALAIANKLSSRTRECADRGIDFEKNLFQLANEEMLIDQLGMTSVTTAETPMALQPQEDVTEPDEEDDADEVSDVAKPKKPAKKSRRSARV